MLLALDTAVRVVVEGFSSVADEEGTSSACFLCIAHSCDGDNRVHTSTGAGPTGGARAGQIDLTSEHEAVSLSTTGAVVFEKEDRECMHPAEAGAPWELTCMLL